MLSKVTF